MASRRAPAPTPPATWAARAVTSAWLGLCAMPVHAAPGDVLLSALPERLGARGHLEAGVGRVNSKIDFTEPEADPAAPDAAAKGNYRDSHLRGAWQASDGLWLSAGLWQRVLSDGVDEFRYQSWQISGMVRLTEPSGPMPALGVRLSAWGNGADVTSSTTPVTVPGAILDSVSISRPSDRQLQLDLIGTWVVNPAWDVSAVLGAGRTQLAYGDLSATTTRNGCRYNLQFNGNDIFGSLAQPCTGNGGGVIQQFYDSSGAYGVDVAKEIAWQGTFLQAGLNAAWQDGPWSVRGGLLMHWARRQDVDDIVATRGQRSFGHTRILALEASRQIHDHLAAVLRLESSSHLFLAELPVTYNASTASRFGGRFSQFSFALRAGF